MSEDTTDGREEVQQQTTPVRPVTEHHLRILLPNTYSVTKYGCKKNAGLPENIDGLIELRYLINLFIHYLPEMTFKKCKRQCY